MKKAFMLLLLILGVFLFSCKNTKIAPNPSVPSNIEDHLSEGQYLNLAITYYNQSKYVQCIEACNKSLQIKPENADAYNIICVAQSVQKNWPLAIQAGEHVLKLNPQLAQVYDNLFYAYNETHQWEKAEDICKKAILLNPGNANAQNNLNGLNANLKAVKISSSIIKIIIALMIYGLGAFVYRNKKNKTINEPGVLELLLISSSVSYLLYLIFYHFSTTIWSFNIKIPSEDFTSEVRGFIFEHDGIEAYVLYSLMFVNILLTIISTWFISKIKNKITYLLIFSSLIFVSGIYFIGIGFFPPMQALNFKGPDWLLLLGVSLLAGLLLLLQKYFHKFHFGIIVLLLIPICFISTGPISIFDYSFILAPALKILKGFPLSEIYFQYDLLLSLLAAIWMKLKLEINSFQILGQISFFLFFIGAFFFAKKFFTNKRLPVFLLISLVIIRFYSIMAEPVSLFQITPLRLDLWLIILLLVTYKGAYHWLVGICIGFFVLVHKNLGLIYLISYFELLFTLLSIEVIEMMIGKKMNFTSLKSIFLKYLALNLKNIIIISGFILVSIIIFKGFIAESALLYQKIGIGMMQISTNSFYWYMPILFSLVFVLLIKYKGKLPSHYLSIGLFILFLTIGNSMYFFGRSHEHNILNISGVLILTIFLLFDLIHQTIVVSVVDLKKSVSKKNQTEPKTLQVKLKKTAIEALPFIFIIGSTYFYSDRIKNKLKTQSENYKKSQFIYALGNQPKDFSTVKKLTNGSKDVYFLNFKNDFLYYYNGNYSPIGYFSPCAAWILKNDLARFLQTLLDKNYYLVTDNVNEIADLLTKINYNKIVSENKFTVISKEKTELLLPETEGNLVHLGMNNTLGNNGIVHSEIELKEKFSIEFIIKPNSSQPESARILSNSDEITGPSGIIIQQNGSHQNEFLFAFGGGKSWTIPAVFKLSENKWNYIAISVNKTEVKIFNNGQVVYSGKCEFGIKNSHLPLTIGNGIGQKNPFSGFIKELKISSGVLSDENILHTMNFIYPGVNKLSIQ